MPLTFPTQAEQCLAAWKTETKTIALATFARKRGADVTISKEFGGKRWSYSFNDDTSLVVSGTGGSHKVEVMLP